MTSPWPVELHGTVTLIHSALTITAYAMTFQMSIPAEAAEWIWQDILGGGDRRIARTLTEAKVFLYPTAIELRILTYTVRRRLSSNGVQQWVARKADPETNQHQEVLHR